MSLEGAWRSNLGCIYVDSHIMSHVDPWHYTGDLVKIHRASRSQAVNNLLHPRGAAFWRGDDEHISGGGLVVKTVLPAFRRGEILHAFMHFLDGCWAFKARLVH